MPGPKGDPWKEVMRDVRMCNRAEAAWAQQRKAASRYPRVVHGAKTRPTSVTGARGFTAEEVYGSINLEPAGGGRHIQPKRHEEAMQ